MKLGDPGSPAEFRLDGGPFDGSAVNAMAFGGMWPQTIVVGMLHGAVCCYDMSVGVLDRYHFTGMAGVCAHGVLEAPLTRDQVLKIARRGPETTPGAKGADYFVRLTGVERDALVDMAGRLLDLEAKASPPSLAEGTE